jgi:predicted amidophosphoribosyltransferase
MSKALKIPVNTSLLIRTKATESQTKKNSTERSLNVSEVFQATENLAGMTVLLIDDVITTGATLSACIAALAQKGCQNVSVAALAAGEK